MFFSPKYALETGKIIPNPGLAKRAQILSHGAEILWFRVKVVVEGLKKSRLALNRI